MNKNNNNSVTVASPDQQQQPRKPRKLKTRQVSSRFLSPISSYKHDNNIIIEKSRSPRQINTQIKRMQSSHKTLADHLLRKDNDRNKGNVTLKENTIPNSITPGRLSFDENSQRNSELFADTSLGIHSVSSYGSTRKLGKQVMSRYLLDSPASHHIRTSDIAAHSSLDGTAKLSKFSLKDIMMTRSRSYRGNGSSSSQWALSPGRSGFSPLSVGTKKKLVMSFSQLSSGTSKAKGIEKLLNIGWGMFKSKKSLDVGKAESIHQLRLLQNRLLQSQYANAKLNVANAHMNHKAERELIGACKAMSKLIVSVMQKRLQLQREKLDMKLNIIIPSQIDKLKAWNDMEDDSVSGVSITTNCLYSVASRLSLIEDAEFDSESMSITLQKLTALMKSIDSTLTSFSQSTEQTVPLISELAKVVAQEKLLLEEAFELLENVSTLEIKGRSLMCGIIQLTMQRKQIEQQDGQPKQYYFF